MFTKICMIISRFAASLYFPCFCIVSQKADIIEECNLFTEWGFVGENIVVQKRSQRDLLVYLIVFLFKLCILDFILLPYVFTGELIPIHFVRVCVYKKIKHFVDARFI